MNRIHRSTSTVRTESSRFAGIVARWTASLLVVAGWIALPAQAVKIADITRIEGQNPIPLSGIGLVSGLSGTGDGGDFTPAIQPLAAMLSAFYDETAAKDLGDVKNVAIVHLQAMIPKDGAHMGDLLNVRVTSMGKATSLKGGTLISCLMFGPKVDETHVGKMFARAQGNVVVEDPSVTTSGVIKDGCEMAVRVTGGYDGTKTARMSTLTLILANEIASWTTASAIAQVVNDSEANGRDLLATATDAKTVVIEIPVIERERPDAFIARVIRLPVPERLLNSEARVRINDKTHTMIISGDVEISPTVISQQGLTIVTTSPKRDPTPANPITTTKEMVPIDTTNTGGAKLRDLVTALDQLKVPAEDRINIIKELHATGKLHAKLLIDD